MAHGIRRSPHLLFSTTAMDFWLGRQIGQGEGTPLRGARWLVASVCMNLSMLGFFKYGNFLLENFQWLMARIGIIYHPPHLDILLPVGISFYTFHSLSYTLDIYRGVLQPTQVVARFRARRFFFSSAGRRANRAGRRFSSATCQTTSSARRASFSGDYR